MKSAFGKKWMDLLCMAVTRLWSISRGVLIVVLLFPVIAAGETGKIRITCDPWAPWMEGKQGEKPTGGVFIQITEALFSRINIEYGITIFPFKRCLRQMQTGERDIMLMVSKTPERETFMAFSDVVLSDPYYLYYSSKRISSFEWGAWDDLKNLRIGVVSGFNYGNDFKAAVHAYRITLDGVTSDLQNIKKLVAGRFDFVILNKTNADALLWEYPEFKKDVKMSGKVLHEAQYRFGFSKKSPSLSLIPAINDTIMALKNDGTMKIILQKYKVGLHSERGGDQ